jgi:hypothetical protein
MERTIGGLSEVEKQYVIDAAQEAFTGQVRDMQDLATSREKLEHDKDEIQAELERLKRDLAPKRGFEEQQEQLDTCLGAGRIAAPCAIVGNPEFRVFQFDGPTSSPTFLVLSPGVLPVPSCSQCPIIADPFQGWVLTDSTNVDGAADVLVPIPAANELIGAELFAQWLTPKPGGCPLFGVPLGQTSPLRLRIE